MTSPVKDAYARPAPTSKLWIHQAPGQHIDDDGQVSVSAAQADAFYREVLMDQVVWTVRDADGYPAPKTSSGQRAQPFWSKRSRAQKILDTSTAYAAFDIVKIAYEDWRERWLPGLERDGLLVGLNWSGRYVTGYDLTPAEVLRNLDARASLASSRSIPGADSRADK